MIKFSIVIIVRKINDYVKEIIFHVKNLNYSNFEVFIITDVKEEFDFGDSRFKLLLADQFSPGGKRNQGARNATGGILAFLDDDSYPEKDWLTNAATIFADASIYALGGPAATPLDAGYSERMSGRVVESAFVSGNTTYRYIPKPKRMVDDYPSVNLFIRKDSFMSVGGFTTEFWPGEDTKLCLDLVKKYGRKFWYDPSVLVYHHRRGLLLPHLKQISRYGQHRGQFAKIFPETSRVPGYFAPSAFVLGIVLGPFFCFLIPPLWNIYYWVIIVYLSVLFFESAKVAFKEKNIIAFFEFEVAVFVTHVVYGINFLIGLLRKPKLKLKRFDEQTGNYVEG